MHSKLAISGEHDLRSDGFPIASLNYKRVAGTLAVGCCQDISTCLSHLHLMPQFADLHARCHSWKGMFGVAGVTTSQTLWKWIPHTP